MRFYIRTAGEPTLIGPSDVDNIKRQLETGGLTPDSEAVVATGQTHSQLKRSTGWIPLSLLLPALANAPLQIQATTQCSVLVGAERRGPFVFQQVKTMWDSGSITADAHLEFDGGNPIPVALALQLFSQAAFSEAQPIVWKIALTPVGFLLGLLTSYLFRPTLLGVGPSLGEWFFGGARSGFGSTIIICGIIGTAVGILVGHLVDANNAKAK